MSSANDLVNPQVSASGEVDSLTIEKFDGQVKEAYHEKLGMMAYFDLKEVVGTNTISNKYMGSTAVQALSPGKDVPGQEAEFDKNQLVVDTMVIARNIVWQLHDVQDDINAKGRLAKEQVAAFVDLEDRMLVQQLAYGAIKNTATKRNDKPRVKGHGFSIDCKVKAETVEHPNAVMAALEFVLEKQLEQNTPLSKFCAIMPWKYFNVLRDAERVVNAQYNTASGAQIEGFVLKSYNLPVCPTNQMPNHDRDHRDANGDVQTHHLFSKASNGYRYDVINTGDDTMANVVAVIFGTEALMVGRSVSLQGKIYWNDKNKCYYIDTWMAEGAIPDRWEQLSVVRVVEDAKASDDITIRTRANRKILPVTNTPLPTA